MFIKEGNESSDIIAVLESKQVSNFIASEYNGAVISVVDNATNGYDSSIDYVALAKNRFACKNSSRKQFM